MGMWIRLVKRPPSWQKLEMRVAQISVDHAKHVEMKRSQKIIIAQCHPMLTVAPATAAEWETTSRSTARSCVAYVTKEAMEAAEAILLTVSGVTGPGDHALCLAVVALRLAPEPS